MKGVKIDDSLIRPAEVDHLIGDASKAKRELGWEPRSTFAEGLAKTLEWYREQYADS